VVKKAATTPRRRRANENKGQEQAQTIG